jgi:DNA-binding PadR family transcriptional regulator
MMQSPLGEFEILVLLAVLQVGDAANGSRVRDDIERRTGRHIARGAVYVTLDRLDVKGLVASRQAPATTERGGRVRRLYRVQPAGVRAIEHSILALDRMRAGLKLATGRS